jgi:ABC-type branched-subunit amino acid transport system substrate-binding protein
MAQGSKTTRRVAALFAASCLVAVACGGDDDGESGGTDAPTTAPAVETGAPTTSAGAPTDSAPDSSEPSTEPSGPVECTGEPYKFGYTTNISADPRDQGEGYLRGAEAAVEAVNKVCETGHPFELVVCDSKADVNLTEQCARDQVDEGILALVSPLPADSEIAVLQEAGIPSFGNSGNGANTLTSPLSFPTFPVIPTVMAFAKGASLEGAKTAQLVVVEGPSSTFNIEITNSHLEKFGIETKGIVNIPLDATDLTVYAGQIVTAEADAVLLELGLDMTENLLKALGQQNMDFTETQVWNGGAIVTQQFVDDFDGNLEGVYTAGPFWPATDPSNPGIAKMLEEYEAAGLSTEGISDWGTTSWHNIHVLNDVIKDLPEPVTAESLVAALNSLVVTTEDYPETGGYDFTQPGIPDDPQLSQMRIFGRKMYIAQIEDGKIVPQYPEFIDPLEGVG